MPAKSQESTSDLRGIRLSGEKLKGLDLSPVQLDGADLSEADLTGTNFRDASLRGAILRGAKIAAADFTGADLTGAELDECVGRMAVFSGARLNRASARNASLRGASFEGASLANSQFDDACLSGASLTRANLESANFQGTDLSEANLRLANVENACFEDTTLVRADLINLCGHHSAQWLNCDVFEANFGGNIELPTRIAENTYLHQFRRKGPGYESLYQVWKLTSDCGRSFARWMLSALALTVLFGCFYAFTELQGVAGTVLSAPLHSFMVMVSLGSGVEMPTGLAGQWLTAAQTALSGIYFAGTIVLLNRKMVLQVR